MIKTGFSSCLLAALAVLPTDVGLAQGGETPAPDPGLRRPPGRSREGAWDHGHVRRHGSQGPTRLVPGDEITVEFDATDAAPLPAGWRRDFLLYSDSWLKDADLNTGTGQAVEPLSFHGMSRYPYGGDDSYPTDAEHRRYLRRYNTRRMPPSQQ